MPLKVSDGIAAYIDDFQKSDAPQFKGKSKKERRDMAIAAYLTAKRGGKPQEENVKSADRKPEVYTKPDGKKSVRMVPVDKEVVKTEAKVNEISDTLKMKYRDKAKETMRLKRAQLKSISKSAYAGATDKEKERASKRADSIMTSLRLRSRPKGESVKEETNFAVSIEGLPMMFMSADSPGMLKQTLRKIVKQPSMIKAVKRVTDAKVKKTFRLKAQGREEDEE